MRVGLVISGGARSLFLLGHKWGTMTSEWSWWSEYQQWGATVLAPRASVRDGVSPSGKDGPRVSRRKFFWKFAFKILPSGAICAKRLASVGMKRYCETRKTGAACITQWNDDGLSAGHSRGTRVYRRGTGPVWPPLDAATVTNSNVILATGQ